MIIPRSRETELRREKRRMEMNVIKLAEDREYSALYWQIVGALLIAEAIKMGAQRIEKCEHELMHCPICDIKREDEGITRANRDQLWGLQ